MNKQREALQVALDTLRGWIGIDEWIWPVTAKETCKKNSLEAIAAIREALAEPFDPVQDAAPDLLAALEALVESVRMASAFEEIQKAEAAIAKAKGEA